MKNTYSTALVALAMAWMPQAMRAQQTPPPPPDNWILDNFEIGAGGMYALSGVKTVTLPATPNTDSDLIGGSRYIILNAAGNPYNQPVEVEVRPSASTSVPSSLVWSVGFAAVGRIDLVYGVSPATMNLNLTGYDRLRINFGGLSSGLNLNIVAEQGGNGNTAAGCSINIPPSSGNNPLPAAFTVDFPLTNFTSNSGGPVDWSEIPVIDIVLQGGPNLSITKFLAIPIGSTEPAATFTCGA